MISPLVNAIAIIAGSLIGILLKKGMPKQISNNVMKALGLCTLYIGITGALKGENTLLLILSMVFGSIVGAWIDLDLRLNQLASWLENRFKKKSENEETSIAEGFVTGSLLFCVGAMAIVGSLQSGLTGNHEMIYAKSILDFIASIIFASTLGIGVAFSAFLVLFYQGSIVLLSNWLAPLLIEGVVAEMTSVGSLVIIALALNLLDITKFKVMNFVPARVFPILLWYFF
jgi:uncharacterized membrane protein YqgA involved in biofilm formation